VPAAQSVARPVVLAVLYNPLYIQLYKYLCNLIQLVDRLSIHAPVYSSLYNLLCIVVWSVLLCWCLCKMLYTALCKWLYNSNGCACACASDCTYGTCVVHCASYCAQHAPWLFGDTWNANRERESASEGSDVASVLLRMLSVDFGLD
jgi:hypothetical protein